MKWLPLGVLASWLLLTTLTPASVSAQTYQEQVEGLNREAMEAYNELDINKAGQLLEQALGLVQEGSLSGRIVAVTNLNLGMVYIGGLGDQQGGLSYFVAAVCHDPGVELDPLISTPDMQQVFAQAQVQAQQGGCGGIAPAPQAGAGVGAMPGQQMAVQQSMQPVVHVPPTEQRTQTPLPLYVELDPSLGATAVNLHYKGLGMDTYRRVPMYAFGSGMAYQITCNDVFEPKVSYYIEAVDDSGRPVASVGSAAVPIEVAVSTMTTQPPPALPGRPAPSSCVAGECPPGVECEQPGTNAIGEDCSSDTECQGGLICGEGDVCLIDGAGSTEVGSGDGWGDGSSAGSGEHKRFFFQAAFTLGFAYATSGKPADRLPPLNRIYVDPATMDYASDPLNSSALDLILPAPYLDAYPERLSEWEPDADSADAANTAYGGDCPGDGQFTGLTFADGTPRNPGDLSRLPSSYCVRVATPGFVPTVALRLNAGYFITERLAASLVARLQLGAGEGTLANLLVGPRAEYLITAPATRGFMLSAFAGFTLGQIQVQPDFADGGSDNAPFIRSGLMGLHLGGSVRYRLADNFGLFTSPEFDLQFPDSLINLDLPIGVELAL